MAVDPKTKDDWRQLLPVLAMVGAVLFTLILGAALQVDSGTDLRASDPAGHVTAPLPAEAGLPGPTPRDRVAREATPPPSVEPTKTRAGGDPGEPEPAVPDDLPLWNDSKIDRLAQRAMDDARRLSAPGDAWTLQFMVTRRAETAQRVVDTIGDDPRLHLLPMLLDDEPCFRICWGSYDSRDQAVAGRDVPAELITLNQEPIPRPIVDLLP